jgi:hypothetical protein
MALLHTTLAIIGWLAAGLILLAIALLSRHAIKNHAGEGAYAYGDVPALPVEATTRGTGGGRAELKRGPSLTRYKIGDIAHRKEASI